MKIGLFCSEIINSSIILHPLAIAGYLKLTNSIIISGFDTPIENEVFKMLLEVGSKIILCPARSTERMRIPKGWKKPIKKGQLKVYSPVAEDQHKVSVKLTWERDLYIASIVDEIIILHAAPGSKTMKLVETILPMGKPMNTIDDPANEHLLKMGLKALELDK